MTNISIKHLSFAYKTNKVLKNLNIDFKGKRVNVILGLNGSGKTTLLNLLCKNITKNEKSIYFDETEINEISRLELSKKISYVPQLTSTNNDFYVDDFLLFSKANTLKFYETPSNKEHEDVIQKAKLCYIDHLLKKKVNELSGGEKQLVHIAAALIQNSEIIILDEPLSALDLINQKRVIDLLNQLVKMDKTVIMTAHNPNICLYLDAFVILLNNGEVVDFGESNEIITPKILNKVYGGYIIFSKDSANEEVTFK